MNNYALRIGIYETNSSSSHSFTMGPRGRLAKTLKGDDKDILYVNTRDWEGNDKFNSPYLKLSYLLCFAYTLYGSISEDGSVSGEYIKIRDMISKVVKDFTGLSEIKVITDPHCEIDHQSTDVIYSGDLEDPEFIREFIFNPGTWVYALWDDYNPGEDFYEPSPNETLLFTLVFNLPGIKESLTLPVKYSTYERSSLKKEINHLLREYVWSGENFYLKTDPDKPSSCVGYNGDLRWGDHIVEPKILLPGDTI